MALVLKTDHNNEDWGDKVMKRKREADDDEDKQTKKSKSSTTLVEDSNKKAQSVLWREEDEITILEGYITFFKDNNKNNKDDKSSTTRGFYSFIHNSLHVEVSRRQLRDILSNLKKTFRANESKRLEKIKNCEDLTFSKPHELKLFELSKRIWGSTSTSCECDDEDHGKDRVFEASSEMFEDHLLERGLDIRGQDESKVKELTTQWRELKLVENKYRLMESNFKAKINQLILDSFES